MLRLLGDSVLPEHGEKVEQHLDTIYIVWALMLAAPIGGRVLCTFMLLICCAQLLVPEHRTTISPITILDGGDTIEQSMNVGRGLPAQY